MSIKPVRIRAIVMAILVLAFVVPWTYAHIAYVWSWKERPTGSVCTGRYCLIPYNEHCPINSGALSDGRTVFMGMTGKVSMRHKIGSFDLSTRSNNNHYEPIGGATELYRGDGITIKGIGTFILKEVRSGTAWFTPNPGKTLFCLDPDPSFTACKEP